MTCPDCGSETDEDNPYCTSCGEPVFVPEPRVVPGGGIPGWDQPDAAAVATSALAAGAKLIVVERRDTWARVLAESGFIGWVDERLLLDPDLVDASGRPMQPPTG